jgi:hypothetical protein
MACNQELVCKAIIRHKEYNHKIIGLFEGKDKMLYILQVLMTLITIMAQHERDGVMLDEKLMKVNYHFIGDLKFLLKILGLKGTGSASWCPRCEIECCINWNENLKTYE